MAGSFGKAFGRELGKNTAKVVSNAMFGDSWSTPYRRVGRTRSEVNITIQNNMHEARMARIRNAENNATENRMLAIDSAVLQNVDKVSAIKIPNNEKQITEVLESLTPNMKNLEWRNGREGRIRNQYSNALLYKYESLLRALRTIAPKSKALKTYGPVARTANMKMMEQLNLDDFVFSADEEELTCQLTALSDILSMRGWKIGQGFSAKYFNDKSSEILSKFKEGIAYYKRIHGESAETIKYSAQASSNTFVGLFKKLLGLWISLFMLGAICFSVWMTKITSQQRVCVFIGVAILIVVVSYIIIRSYSKRKSRIKELELKKAKEMEESQTVSEGTPSKTSKCNEEILDLFIDLDSNNRIDTRLNEIWAKYSKILDNVFMTRKPIYAADGVKDSILFVGVNPSYTEGEDSMFIPSFSGKNLLYGSFYKRNDAPAYFMELEQFAFKFGLGYTHINLLYARENDRDSLMRSNADFIREQLELTYDTIRQLNPRMIVFFSEYCKDLVYGTDRWTRPSRRGTHNVLNGTDIPVIFTNDITIMAPESLVELENEIRSILS